jgi:hypothetical protein
MFRDNSIVALRALASTTSTASGQDVPFFLLPDLGGNHGSAAISRAVSATATGCCSPPNTAGRPDRSSTWPCSWTPAKSRRASASSILRGLATSYGVGISLHTPHQHGDAHRARAHREGNSLVFSFSPSF